MNEIIFKQFELARGWSIEVSESVSKEIVSVQPRGFNNTIQWQIGHILTSTEYFLFQLPDDMNHLPANYTELFGSGTKPDDWKEDAPAVDELVRLMKDQLDRIRKISAVRLNERLKKPIHGFETIGDCAGFSVLHEVLHIGKIEEMERVIQHSGVKN